MVPIPAKITVKDDYDPQKEGRVYTITYSATDGSGNKALASATVTVPQDREDGDSRGKEEGRKKK
jgi:hypothetical protein